MTPNQISQYEELAGALCRATAAHIADMCQALNGETRETVGPVDRTGVTASKHPLNADAPYRFDRACGTARAMLDAQRAMILDLETQAARQGFRS